jgi:hypothetical protein
MMQFSRTESVSINGTHLQDFCHSLTDSIVIKVFGVPNKEAYWAPEDGYDGMEYHFVSDHGDVVSLYARWGNWRIGAHNADVADAFKAWLAGVVAA